MTKKKLFYSLLSVALIGTMLTGCSFGKDKKEEEQAAAPQYELVAYHMDDEAFQKDWYYVKDGDDFYPIASANEKTFEGFAQCAYVYSTDNTVAEGENVNYDYQNDPLRCVFYNQKDVKIPTLYKDQQLVFVAGTSNVPETYYLERFKDAGWTLGIRELKVTDAGKVQCIVKSSAFFQGSDMHNKTTSSGKVSADDTLVLDTVNSAAVSADKVDAGGFLTGLKQDQEYPVKMYRGSELVSLEAVKADVHAYTAFEKYAFNTYGYSDSGYITLQLPSILPSGYYYINGVGMFRYINAYASDGLQVADVDFNAQYYYTDENGVTYTNSDLSATPQAPESTETGTEVENQDGSVYTNKFTIDSSAKALNVLVQYEDATVKVDGQQMQISDAEAGLPSAKLIDPNGVEYLLEQGESHSLVYNLKGATMGEYILEIYNCSQRIFTVATNVETGNSDTLIHTGSGRQALTYYLKNSYKNGIFTITWENTSHAANVIITAPDGTQYGKTIDESCIVKDDYGLIQIRTGEVKYGEYVISIEGEELGRVLVAASESAQDANEVNEETTEATDTTEATETTEAAQ